MNCTDPCIADTDAPSCHGPSAGMSVIGSRGPAGLPIDGCGGLFGGCAPGAETPENCVFGGCAFGGEGLGGPACSDGKSGIGLPVSEVAAGEDSLGARSGVGAFGSGAATIAGGMPAGGGSKELECAISSDMALWRGTAGGLAAAAGCELRGDKGGTAGRAAGDAASDAAAGGTVGASA